MATALNTAPDDTQPLIEGLRNNEQEPNSPGARLTALLEQFSRTALA